MQENYKPHGISLITGSILLVGTMVLHPTHLEDEMLLINVISHSLAVLSLPFCLYGFWGLSHAMREKPFAANIGFCFVAFGLIAGMLAAAINGLATTQFFKSKRGVSQEEAMIMEFIFDYSFALNNALSYVFIGAIMIAIGFWSISILIGSSFKKWVGYFGLALILVSLFAIILGVNFMLVWTFRLFIFGMVSWICVVSIKLYRMSS